MLALGLSIVSTYALTSKEAEDRILEKFSGTIDNILTRSEVEKTDIETIVLPASHAVSIYQYNLKEKREITFMQKRETFVLTAEAILVTSNMNTGELAYEIQIVLDGIEMQTLLPKYEWFCSEETELLCMEILVPDTTKLFLNYFEGRFLGLETDSFKILTNLYKPEQIGDMKRIRFGKKNPVHMVCKGKCTSGYGTRINPVVLKKKGIVEYKTHFGFDIPVPTGTQLRAMFDGIIIPTDTMSEDYGNCIAVKNYNGLIVFYAHASQLLFKAGDKVQAGDVIALSGESGEVTGQHVHIEFFYEKIDRAHRLSPNNFLTWLDAQGKQLETARFRSDEFILKDTNTGGITFCTDCNKKLRETENLTTLNASASIGTRR